jgi:hypothetical protein
VRTGADYEFLDTSFNRDNNVKLYGVGRQSVQGVAMRKLEGGGLLVAGILLLIVGIVLRWDLIDWLIDATGLILIIIGVILGIIGLIQTFSGGGRKSSEF